MFIKIGLDFVVKVLDEKTNEYTSNLSKEIANNYDDYNISFSKGL